MNTNVFTYSLLRYVHSVSAGEALNVGILFIFPEQQRVQFLYPTKLSRLSRSYHGFPDFLVKANLKGISQKAQRITKQWNLFYDEIISQPDLFVSREFLLEDATALQFSEFRTGILDEYDAYGEIIEMYYKLYFSNYDEQSVKRTLHNEEYIRKKLDAIIKREKKIQQYIQKDVKIEANNGLSLMFDYCWQNHQQHLIKPLSFDLEKLDVIQEKSAKIFGYLALLEQTAKDENYKFDLLVTRPTNPNLYKAYDNALKILELIPTDKEIVEEDKFVAYTEKIRDEIVG
jgi:hypothetical protein